MSGPTGTEAEVCADIAERQRIGMGKYKISVADNPLPLIQWLKNAYEEQLDNAVYLKKAMNELEWLHEQIEIIAQIRECRKLWRDMRPWHNRSNQMEFVRRRLAGHVRRLQEHNKTKEGK